MLVNKEKYFFNLFFVSYEIFDQKYYIYKIYFFNCRIGIIVNRNNLSIFTYFNINFNINFPIFASQNQ